MASQKLSLAYAQRAQNSAQRVSSKPEVRRSGNVYILNNSVPVYQRKTAEESARKLKEEQKRLKKYLESNKDAQNFSQIGIAVLEGDFESADLLIKANDELTKLANAMVKISDFSMENQIDGQIAQTEFYRKLLESQGFEIRRKRNFVQGKKKQAEGNSQAQRLQRRQASKGIILNDNRAKSVSEALVAKNSNEQTGLLKRFVNIHAKNQETFKEVLNKRKEKRQTETILLEKIREDATAKEITKNEQKFEAKGFWKQLGIGSLQALQYLLKLHKNETVRKIFGHVVKGEFKELLNTIGAIKYIDTLFYGIMGLGAYKGLKFIWNAGKKTQQLAKAAWGIGTKAANTLKGFKRKLEDVVDSTKDFYKRFFTKDGRRLSSAKKVASQQGVFKQESDRLRTTRNKLRLERKKLETLQATATAKEKRQIQRNIKELEIEQKKQQKFFDESKTKLKTVKHKHNKKFNTAIKRDKIKINRSLARAKADTTRATTYIKTNTAKAITTAKVKTTQAVTSVNTQQVVGYKKSKTQQVGIKQRTARAITRQKLMSTKGIGLVMAQQSVAKQQSTRTIRQFRGSGMKLGGGILKSIAKFAKFIPGLGVAITQQSQAYSGYMGWKHQGDILGLKESEVTTVHRYQAQIGAIVSDVSFGIIGQETVAKIALTQQKFVGIDIGQASPDFKGNGLQNIENTEKEIEELQKQLEYQTEEEKEKILKTLNEKQQATEKMKLESIKNLKDKIQIVENDLMTAKESNQPLEKRQALSAQLNELKTELSTLDSNYDSDVSDQFSVDKDTQSGFESLMELFKAQSTNEMSAESRVAQIISNSAIVRDSPEKDQVNPFQIFSDMSSSITNATP